MNWRTRPTLTVREVAQLTGLRLRDVSKLIEDGTLGSVSVRGTTLVHVDDVRSVFDKPETEPLDPDVKSLLAKARNTVS